MVKIGKKIGLRSGLVALGALGLAGVASAGVVGIINTQRQSISDIPFTGPLQAFDATSLPAGHWNIKSYLIDGVEYGTYGGDGNERGASNSQRFRSITRLRYGVTDNLTLRFTPIFGHDQVGGGANTDGVQLGDFRAGAQYMIHKFHEGSPIPTIGVYVGETLPTGRYDGLDKTANGLGNGVWYTEVSLLSQDYFWMPNGHILRTRLNVSYQFPDDNGVSVNGRSVYGSGPGFSGEINPGNTFTLDASGEYALTDKWVPVFEIVYTHTTHGTTSGTALFTQEGQLASVPVRVSNSSTDSLSFAPAIEYLFGRRFSLIGGARFTVTGRNTGAVVAPQIALNMFF